MSDTNEEQELGGAQVLVQLSSKTKDGDGAETSKKKEGQKPPSSHSPQNDTEPVESGHDADKHDTNDAHRDDRDDDDESKTNQQINEAVEAAVMKYVGGNLDHEDRKGKKRLHSDEIIPEFQGWQGFLEENIDHQSEDLYQSNGQDNSGDSQDQPGGSGSRTSDSGAGYNTAAMRESGSSKSGKDNRDMESSEHDELVRAAILETRELAKQLSSFNGLNNLAPHQQHQVIVALQNNIAGNGEQFLGHKKRKNKELRDRIVKHIKTQAPAQEPEPKDFSHINNIDQLSVEAQNMAMEWFKHQPETKGPRPFATEERQAVDYFIEGYCYLNKTDRKGVCNRIWTTERRKDNFWESLTKVLPYRSRASIYKHVRRQYHVFDVRGKWTPEEDDKLRTLAASKPGNWKEIGALMGRMSEDCRDRWRNYIKCGENRIASKWSPEEEQKLKQIVTEMAAASGVDSTSDHAYNWTLVSERMNGTRSRIQCRYKWNKIVKRDALARVSFLEDDVRLWLFEHIKSMGYNSQKDVDWGLLAKMHNEKYPHADPLSATDLQFGFDKLRSVIREHRMYEFPQLMDQLIRETRRSVEDKGGIEDKDRSYLWG